MVQFDVLPDCPNLHARGWGVNYQERNKLQFPGGHGNRSNWTIHIINSLQLSNSLYKNPHVTAPDFCGIRIHMKLNSSISQETRTNYLCRLNKANQWVRWRWRFFFSSLLTNWIYNLIIHTWGSDCSSVEVHELPKISSTHPSKKKQATLLDFDIDNHRGKYQQLSPRRHFERHLSTSFSRDSEPRFHNFQDGVQQKQEVEAITKPRFGRSTRPEQKEETTYCK